MADLIPNREAFTFFSFGLSAIKDTTEGLKKVFQSRITIKKDKIKKNKIKAARLLNKKKRDAKEKLIESKSTPLSSGSSGAQELISSTQTWWESVLNAIVLLFSGWLLDKLPKIIEEVTKVWNLATSIWKAVTIFYQSVLKSATALGALATQYMDDMKKGKLLGSAELTEKYKALEKAAGDVGKDWDRAMSSVHSALDAYKNIDLDPSKVPPSPDGNTGITASENPEDPTGQQMFEYLMTKPGMTENKAAGIVANAYGESGFDTDIRSGDDGGPGGLFQMRAGRGIAMEKAVPNWETNWKGQVDHMLATDRAPEYMGMKFSSQEAAAEAFMNIVERPNVKHRASRTTKHNKYLQRTNLHTPAKNDGKGDGVRKVVTPGGLGLDHYRRPIVLNPDAAKGWKEVVAAAAAQGVDLPKDVTSSYRTPAEQEALINDPSAMTPASVDTSPHVQGWAVDISVGTPGWNWLKKNGARYGWRWNTNPKDPVHFDYMRGNSDNNYWKQRSRNYWMRKGDGARDKVDGLKTSAGKKIIVPMPINRPGVNTPPQSRYSPPPHVGVPADSGPNLFNIMSILNRAFS